MKYKIFAFIKPKYSSIIITLDNTFIILNTINIYLGYAFRVKPKDSITIYNKNTLIFLKFCGFKKFD